MFLINSRLGLFTAGACAPPLIPKLRGQFAEFLNYPSPVGLRILFLSPCVGLRYGLRGYTITFSRLPLSVLPYYFRSLSTGSTIARLVPFQGVPLLKSFDGYGISTVCASTTPFGLALAPDYLEADEPSFKNLRFSAIMILT